MASVLIDGRYLSDHYPGIGRWVFNLVKALATVAPEQPLILLVDGEPQTRFDLGALESRGVCLVPVDRGPRAVGGRLTIGRACRRIAPSLFHAPHVFSATRVRCASVVTINDLIPLQDPDTLQSARHRLVYRALLRRALTSADGIVTLSRAVRDDLATLKGVPPERVAVVPGAADCSFRPASEEQLAAVRERLGLPRRYSLYVGTDRPHKNLARLLEAWGGLTSDQRAGCRLVVAGPDPADVTTRGRTLAQRAAALLLGPVDETDLPALYSGARLVVQPSLREGFGLPVVEAMACGAAVACSRIGALDEVSGGAALQFVPTDIADIGSTIARALNDDDLRQQLVARGLRRAGELSWERAATLTLDVYRQAFDRHATAARV